MPTIPKNQKPKTHHLQSGFSMVEVILASSIFALIVVSFVGVFLYGQEATALAGKRSSAVFLAEEGLEAARNIRDSGIGGLADGTHGLAISGGQWSFSGSQDVSGVFTREIAISAIDAERKQITSTVTWQQNRQRAGTVSMIARLTNWLASGIGNWAVPGLESSFNFTAANSGNATANGTAVAFAGNRVYLARANSAGREFYIFDVSSPAAPALLGQRDLNGTPNDIAISGNYAYVASTDNSQELQIIDISDPATINQPGKLTTVDLTAGNSGDATADALSVAVSGTYLLMTRGGGDEFLIFNLASPSAPGSPVGRTNTLTGTASDLDTSGNYAYVASTDNAAELQIVDITTKTAPLRVAVFNLASGNAGADGLSIALANNHAFVGRASSVAPELYTINVSNPLAPVLADTLEIGANVRAVSVEPNSGYAFLATADTANDFKVVDGSDPLSISLLGQVGLANGPVDIIYDLTLDRAFLASTADTEELEIVQPQ